MRAHEFIIENKTLLEGGNVVITTTAGKEVPAQKVDLSTVDRSQFAKDMLKAFNVLDQKYQQMHGEPLWPDKSIFKDGHVFNGSSEAMFNNSISDEKYVSVKPSVGDIDITVPGDTKETLWKLLKTLTESKLTSNVWYLGDNRPNFSPGNEQINSIFRYMYAPGETVNVQVDFEFLPYDQGKPTEFSKFGHSSHWDDLSTGIKGVHHKYILRALAGGSSIRDDIVIMTNTATPAKPRPKKMPSAPTMMAFFIGKGVRIKYEQQFMPDGTPWIYEGKQVYKEIPTKDSHYEGDLSNIFKLFFGEPKSPAEVKKLWSFTGILELMKQYHSPEQIKSTLQRLLDLYWAPYAQGLERNNPELDNKIKSAGWDKVLKVFPAAEQFNTEEMKKVFYDKYKMSGDVS